MSDLIRWEYAGIEFKVSPDLTPDQRDGVCSVLLSEYDHRNQGRSEHVSDYHGSHSKPLINNSEGMSPPETEDRLEDRTEALETILELRNECRVCGKVIPPTGRRGRPRKIHEECKA